MRILPFQKAIQNDLKNNKSCLIILSKGLGVYNVIYNFLRTLEIKNTCIFLLNLSLIEFIYFKLFASVMDDQLNLEETDNSEVILQLSKRIEIINSETNLQKRISLYNKGGIYSISSRIFLTDALSKKLNFKYVSGIILFNAETLNSRNWNDAFILQLFKSENPCGFIKGISQRPENLATGYFGPGVAMKYIGTTALCLYPRSNFLVENSLKQSRNIKVIEKAVKATEHFYIIQKCIVALIEKGLNEILKLDSTLEISVSDVLYSSTKKLQSKIDSINQDLWNKMTPKHRQITKDIIFFKNLLEILYSLDSTSFFFSLELIRSLKLIDPSWMLTPEFEALFKSSRNRVFRIYTEKRAPDSIQFEKSSFNLSLEVNPVFIQLLDILINVGNNFTEDQLSVLNEDCFQFELNNFSKEDLEKEYNLFKNDFRNTKELNEGDEIEHENFDKTFLDEVHFSLNIKTLKCPQNRSIKLPEYRILIVFPEDFFQNTDEIENLILKGPQYFTIQRFIELCQSFQTDLSSSMSHILQKITSIFGTSMTVFNNEQSYSLNQFQIIISKLLQQHSKVNYSCSSKDVFINSLPEYGSEPLKSYLQVEKNKVEPKIIISNIKTNIQGKFWNVLCLCNPHLVITLDPEISIVREIELFTALNDKLNLELIIITIQNSIRHEKYLQDIKAEENSWANLERHKKTLIIPLSDISEEEILAKLTNPSLEQIEKTKSSKTQQVIVDTREFRSSLPYQLFCKGIQIIPLTLAIGDYVISRDVCIERKSIRDLISSLNNGRLYTQLQWLTKYYTTPVILIELGNSTELLNYQRTQQNFVPTHFNLFDTYSKLILLIRHFPNIKIIWSSNASFSSSIILHIKNFREQPDVNSASMLNTGILNIEENISNKKDEENISEKKRKRTFSNLIKSNYYALVFLRQLPGVNAKNIKILTSKFCSLREIVNASLEELTEHLGVSNGTTLFRAVNENLSEIVF